MEPLIHVANVVLLASYAVRDILWLRVLTVVGLGVLVVHDLDPAGPIPPGCLWGLAFIALNGAHSAWLLWERRPLRLDTDETAVRYLLFEGTSDAQFRALMATATWEDHLRGSGLLRSGEPVRYVRLIVEGRAAAVRDQRTLHHLGPGEFVGEIGFVTGEPSSAAVIATETTRSLAWPVDDLRRLLDRDPNLRAAFLASLGTDLASKLRVAS